MIAPPMTYVRNSQASAMNYNQQIMRQMVPFSGTLPSYYAHAQQHYVQQQHIPVYYNFNQQVN